MLTGALDLAAHDLLKRVGGGTMSSLAYDTAWVARLGEVDRELGDSALDWLRANQLENGSWGAREVFYYHDRLISTLAAMIALARCNGRARDAGQIETGARALERITKGATAGLPADPNGATVGFEMIAPTLVAEAEELGLITQRKEEILARFEQQRQKKLGLLKGRVINREITAAFSAEMAGTDGQHMLDVENLQEANGSVGHSPSASAYFALHLRPGDARCLAYLREVVSPLGGAPDLVPFDVFEKCWAVWNLTIAGAWGEAASAAIDEIASSLAAAWTPGVGAGLSVGYSIPDGDNTAFVFEVLSRLGRQPDTAALFAFEGETHFCTYQLEANSSNSVNIHMLGALRQAGFPVESDPVLKTLAYLAASIVDGAYWYDKWHLSPYYSTAHAVIACAGFADVIIQRPVEWILATQRAEGAWGLHAPTAEETAYCIQALQVWRQCGGKVPAGVVRKAAAWLQAHAGPPYPPLWIGKGLYAPEIVVGSAVLSALRLAGEG